MQPIIEFGPNSNHFLSYYHTTFHVALHVANISIVLIFNYIVIVRLPALFHLRISNKHVKKTRQREYVLFWGPGMVFRAVEAAHILWTKIVIILLLLKEANNYNQ